MSKKYCLECCNGGQPANPARDSQVWPHHQEDQGHQLGQYDHLPPRLDTFHPVQVFWIFWFLFWIHVQWDPQWRSRCHLVFAAPAHGHLCCHVRIHLYLSCPIQCECCLVSFGSYFHYSRVKKRVQTVSNDDTYLSSHSEHIQKYKKSTTADV